MSNSTPQKSFTNNNSLSKSKCYRKYQNYSFTVHNSLTVYLLTTLLIFLPSLSRCHVGSLPLGKERKQDIRDIIYCNFVKLGDGKPPLLNHVRVSRGPVDEYNLGSSGGGFGLTKSEEGTTGRLSNFIKSPSYQHKLLHASQFHGNPTSYSSPHHGGNTDFALSTNPIYPVASVYMKGSMNRKGAGGLYSNNVEVGRGGDEDNLAGDSWYNAHFNPNNPDNTEQQQEPTFTPFIGARALSNIPQFFLHLRENLEALHQNERLEGLSSWENSGESAEIVLPTEHEHKDLPSRRGDYFQSDGRLSINPDEYGYSYDENGKPVAGDKGQEAAQDLLNYMGRDPKYKKANNYNPSWLMGIGLGKRSNSA